MEKDRRLNISNSLFTRVPFPYHHAIETQRICHVTLRVLRNNYRESFQFELPGYLQPMALTPSAISGCL